MACSMHTARDQWLSASVGLGLGLTSTQAALSQPAAEPSSGQTMGALLWALRASPVGQPLRLLLHQY